MGYRGLVSATWGGEYPMAQIGEDAAAAGRTRDELEALSLGEVKECAALGDSAVHAASLDVAHERGMKCFVAHAFRWAI